MNCVIYARVSTGQQAEKGLSLPAQLSAARSRAEGNGWKVAGEWVEPGESARTADRPELKAMLAFCRDGSNGVGAVVVHKVDRLARSLSDHVAIRASLQKCGVRVVSVTENLEDSVSGRLVENIMASLAEFYSANLADEVRKGMRQKVLGGGWPHQPQRGYRAVAGGIEVDPAVGPLVAAAFDLFATGWHSIESLASAVWDSGLRSRHGSRLSPSYVRSMLANPFYVGLLRWPGLAEVAGAHRPIVTAATFAAVQRQLASRREDRRGSIVQGFPLRGVAVCATCRGRMTPERHAEWRYYRCCRRSYDAKRCDGRFCPAPAAHRDLERICRSLPLPDAAALRDSIEAAARMRKEALDSMPGVAERERERRRRASGLLTDAFMAGRIGLDEYRAASAKAEEELATLERRLEPDPHGPAAVVGGLPEGATLWDLCMALPDPQRSAVVRVSFEAVVLSRDGMVGHSLRTMGAEQVAEALANAA